MMYCTLWHIPPSSFSKICCWTWIPCRLTPGDNAQMVAVTVAKLGYAPLCTFMRFWMQFGSQILGWRNTPHMNQRVPVLHLLVPFYTWWLDRSTSWCKGKWRLAAKQQYLRHCCRVAKPKTMVKKNSNSDPSGVPLAWSGDRCMFQTHIPAACQHSLRLMCATLNSIFRNSSHSKYIPL